jgi:hypothetical protein
MTIASAGTLRAEVRCGFVNLRACRAEVELSEREEYSFAASAFFMRKGEAVMIPSEAGRETAAHSESAEEDRSGVSCRSCE